MITIEDRLAAARSHLDAGRSESAFLLFESVADRSPNNVDALNGLAAAKLEMGELDEAFALAQRAVELNAGRPDALETLARLLLLAGQAIDAEAALDHALEIDATHPACSVMKSGVLMDRGAFGEAERLLAAAHLVHPANADVLIALAGLYHAADLTGPALRTCQQALALEPDRLELLAVAGTMLADLGSHAEAVPLLERVHLARPSNPVLLLRLGESQAAIGELSEARRLLRRAVALFPEFLPAWEAHIRVSSFAGDERQALDAFIPVAKTRRDKPAALLALATAYRCVGNVDAALKLVEPLLTARLEPPLPARAASLARDCYLALGRFGDLSRVPMDTGQHPAPEAKGFFIDSSMSSLEALVLLRFASTPQAKPVEIEAGDHLRDIVGLVEGVTFRPREYARSGTAVPAPLSAILATRLPHETDVGRAVPYICPDEERRALWARSLAHLPRPLVALAWDVHRPGILLEDYRPLLSQIGGTLVSVAWDEARHQLADWPGIIDGGAHFRSLADLAAVLAQTDCLIGPDGLATHVAGAMGLPCAVLTLPAAPWYWRANDEDRSQWYPSVRVMPAPAFGSWHDLLPLLAAPLADFVTQFAAPHQVEARSAGGTR